MSYEHVRVGVGVLVIKDGKVLWSKRKSELGKGTYAFVGGHVEHGETVEHAAIREVAEECGIKIKNLRLLSVSDFMTYLPKHFLDVGFVADWESGEPQLLEPDKFELWEWRDIDAPLPAPLFPACAGYLEAYKGGRTYFTYPYQPQKD